MFTNRSITQAFVLSSGIILFLLVCFLGYFWIYEEYLRLNREAQNIETEHIETQKQLMKDEVQRTINYVAFMKSQAQQRIRREIREYVYGAHAMAGRLYELNRGSMTEQELERLLVETLRPIRFEQGRIYYFATGLDGVEQLFPDRPEMEQKDLIDLQDSHGRYVVRDLVNLVREQGEGFYEYTWTKPGKEGGDFPKISFVKYFEPFDWFIGTGEYLDDIESDLKKEALERISRISFGNEGYIFVMRNDGLILCHPDKKLVGTNIIDLTDPQGVPLGRELISASRRSGGGYVKYTWPKLSTGVQTQKLSYAVSFQEWGWVIGTGVYLDDLELAIAAEQKGYRQTVLRQMLFIIVLFISFIIISLLIARFISKKTQTGIDSFMTFFRRAATSYEKIDTDVLTFNEFRTIGEYANKLVDDFRHARVDFQKSEEKYRMVSENIPVVVYSALPDDHSTTLFITGRIDELTGYSKKEFLEDPALWMDVIFPQDRDHVLEKLREHRREKGPLNIEYRIIAKDGAVKWLRDAATPSLDDEGQIIRIDGFLEDITERKNAEDKIRESEERFRTIFESTTDGIIVIDLETRLLVAANHAFCDMLGYTLEEVKTLRVQGIHPPEALDWVLKQFERQVKGESFISLDIPVQRKDGSIFYADINSSMIVLEGQQLLLGMLRDTSQRREAEQALQESEERYRLLAENARDVIWVLDMDLRFMYVSPSVKHLRGYSVEEAMKQGIEEILTPESYRQAVEILGEEFRLEQSGHSHGPDWSRTLELEMVRSDGSTVWTEVTVTLLYDREGKPYRIMGITRDITERRQMEEQRRILEASFLQSQKMEAIGTLAGGIAHDFNNILSAIIGYTELALTEDGITPEINDHLSEVLKAGNRARDLVRQILTFSRQKEGEAKPIMVKNLVNEALKLLRASLPSTIEIRRIIRSDGMVLADPTQINQVIMNLCTNAGQAMESEGGVLTVELDQEELDAEATLWLNLKEPGPYVVLTVNDTGTGIPAKIMERIFEPYYTTKEKGKGTGLGLAIVHGIVAGIGGAISVKSQPGRGSTFMVYLPRIVRMPEEEAAEEMSIPTGTESILLVDDEAALTYIGKQVLERLGYSVTTRTSSIEALELFKTDPDRYDLVITDMTMPNLTGDRLARNILEVRPDIPIILCTGYSEIISEEQARAIGIRAFILKPLVKRDLAGTIRRVLDQR